MPEIHFLPVKTAKTLHKTKREAELDQADVRSHAAKISHRHAGRGHVARHPTFPTKRLPPLSPLEAAAVHSGTLDPFFPLPLTLESHDRYLLQRYLQIDGKAVYRVSNNPVYCPIRDAIAAEISSNALLIRWVCYLSSVSTGTTTTAVLARRADNYTQMLQMLGNPAVARLDSTLMVLLAAAVTEHYCGNVILAYKHWTGVLGHVRGYLGGLRAVQRIGFAKGMALVEGILMQHVPLFESRARLSEAMSRLSVPRARVSLDERVRKFFGPDAQGSSERDIAFHLANLHLVSMMLVGEWVGFMVELVRLLLGGGEELTSTGVTFMICQSAVRTGEWYGEAPKLRMWETLEFVRVIMYAGAESRKMVIRAMSAPLLGFSGKYVDLEVLKREIEAGWELMHGWSSGESTDGRQNGSTVAETGEPTSALGDTGTG